MHLGWYERWLVEVLYRSFLARRLWWEQVPVSGSLGRSVYSSYYILKCVERFQRKVVPLLSVCLLRSWKSWGKPLSGSRLLLARLSSGNDSNACFNC